MRGSEIGGSTFGIPCQIDVCKIDVLNINIVEFQGQITQYVKMRTGLHFRIL